MRTLRWNKRYLTGDSGLDERNKALLALLADLRTELGRIEHCQEMNELADRLVGLTKQMLARPSRDAGLDPEFEAAIKRLLKNDFPLAALSTPACRECGLCDRLADRVAKWLSDGPKGRGNK